MDSGGVLAGAEAGKGGFGAVWQPDAGNGLGTQSSVGSGAKRAGQGGPCPREPRVSSHE